HGLPRAGALGRRAMATAPARDRVPVQEGHHVRAHRRLGAGPDRPEGRQGAGQVRRRGRGAARTGGTVAAEMTSAHEKSGTPAPDVRETQRQILYWRLLAGIFDPEPQHSLDAASVAIVDDLGLPAALLDPGVAVDTVIQRFPELKGEFDRLGAA